MPGMMDTVLNLGLTDASVLGLAQRTGNERFAWDSYRRLVQMYGNVVRGGAGRAASSGRSRGSRTSTARRSTPISTRPPCAS